MSVGICRKFNGIFGREGKQRFSLFTNVHLIRLYFQYIFTVRDPIPESLGGKDTISSKVPHAY